MVHYAVPLAFLDHYYPSGLFSIYLFVLVLALNLSLFRDEKHKMVSIKPTNNFLLKPESMKLLTSFNVWLLNISHHTFWYTCDVFIHVVVEWYGLNGVTTTLCGFFFTLGSFFVSICQWESDIYNHCIMTPGKNLSCQISPR